MINLKSLSKNIVATNLVSKLAKKAGMSQKNAQRLAVTVVPIAMKFILNKINKPKTVTKKK